MPSCPGRVPCVSACGRKPPLMPRPSLWHPVCFQPSCAHRCVREWLQDVMHGRERRSGRFLRTGVASLARLHGSVTKSIYGCVILVLFGHRGEPLGVHFGHDKAGVRQAVERRCSHNLGPWRPHLCKGCTPCWSQVDWLPCAHTVSDAVTHTVSATWRACYVTDITICTAHHRFVVGV